MIRHANSRAENLQDIAYSVKVIARIVSDDLVRQASADRESLLGEFDLGGLMVALEQLADHADGIGEEIWKEEERQAQLLAEHSRQEGQS